MPLGRLIELFLRPSSDPKSVERGINPTSRNRKVVLYKVQSSGFLHYSGECTMDFLNYLHIHKSPLVDDLIGRATLNWKCPRVGTEAPGGWVYPTMYRV